MKKLFVLLLLAAALFVTPVFADTSDPTTGDPSTGDPTTGEEQQPYVITVSSADELSKVLSSEPGANGPVIVQFTEGTVVSDSIYVPYNVTLDLNGGTLNGYVDLEGNNSSIINGTLNKGGIEVRSNDSGGTISSMTIKNAPGMSIEIRGGKIGDITNNTITGSKDHAIRLFNNAVAGDITGNTITDCKGDGVSVYNGSHCGKISGNKLKNIGDNSGDDDYGITINSHGNGYTYAKEITRNTVDTTTFAAIVVHSAAKGHESSKDQDKGYVKGDIAYNTVKNACTYLKNKECQAAIYVDSYATVKGAIHHNKVLKCYDNGISVITHSHVGKIYSNTVKNARPYGIFAGNKSKIQQVSNNKITMNQSRKGMGVISNTGCLISKISGNKITGKYTVGIRIIAAKKKVTITGNTITAGNPSGVWSRGISANNCSSLVITKNKITGNKTGPGIYVPKCKAKITSNKITKSTHKVSK